MLAWSQHLFCLVLPNGVIQPAKQPFVRYEMWQIANAPTPDDCPCGDYIDLETQGPWSLRDSKDHHPMCQFDRHSAKTFKEAGRQAVDRMGLVLDEHGRPTVNAGGELVRTRQGPAQARPDEWIRIREEQANR